MRCPECETLNRADARYCKQCGTALVVPSVVIPATDAQRIVCANCGALLRANARFCARCGQSIIAVSQPSSRVPSASLPEAADSYAQPLSGRANRISPSISASGGIMSGAEFVEYAPPVYTAIPTPAPLPVRRRTSRWIWFVGGAILFVLTALIVVRVVMVLDLFASANAPELSPNVSTFVANDQIALAVTSNPVRLATPVTVTVTFTNTHDVALRNVRVYLEDAGQPLLRAATTLITLPPDVEIAPRASESWGFVLDAVAVGDAAITASVAAELNTDPPTPDVWRIGPLPVTVEADSE
jgi:hypothetical protein